MIRCVLIDDFGAELAEGEGGSMGEALADAKSNLGPMGLALLKAHMVKAEYTSAAAA